MAGYRFHRNRFYRWLEELWLDEGGNDKVEASPWTEVLGRCEAEAPGEGQVGPDVRRTDGRGNPLRVYGQLRESTVPRLLQSLGRSRFAGRLTLVAAEGRAELRVSAGVLLTSRMDPGGWLGEHLLETGLLPQHALLDALKIQQIEDGWRPLGTLLLERGLLEERALRWALYHHTETHLKEVVEWSEGFFTWEDASLLPPLPGQAFVEHRMRLDRVLTNGECSGASTAGALDPWPQTTTKSEGGGAPSSSVLALAVQG